MEALDREVLLFQAGNIARYPEAWKRLTSDKFILDIVQNGLKLNFLGEVPENNAFEYNRSAKETELIDSEVKKLLDKGVISLTTEEDGDYFSNLFTTPKKDGTYRTILNLKKLNKECDTKHFKMESLKQAIHMVRPNAFLASIDIKDAFYSVPINDSHKNTL